MKKLISSCIVLILSVAYFTGCQQDPNSSDNMGSQLPMAARVKPDANPAFTFSSDASSKGKQYPTIAVSDVDGGDRAHVYMSSVTSNRTLFATWSPTGTSVSFVDMPGLTGAGTGWSGLTVWGNYAIKAIDVSVANGVASGRNVRTIYSVTEADQMKILSQVWCPATSGAGAGKIAFMVYTPTECRIYLISENGGTPTLIYSTTNTDNRLQANSLTWSSDGTKIAFAHLSGTSTAAADVVYSIKIIDLSGTVLTTLLSGWKTISELQWSNAGVDKISFEGSATSLAAEDRNKYILDIATATATVVVPSDWGGYGMYWSPDNTQLVYWSENQHSYIYTVATGVSTLVGSLNAGSLPTGDWK